jgi:outer membrane receptor protein involved in Fe transport
MKEVRMRALSLALLILVPTPAAAHLQVATNGSPYELPTHAQAESGVDILSRRAGLDVSGATLTRALQLLQERSGVSIAFSPSLLPMDRIVTCQCSGLTVADALRQLLPDDGFRFKVFRDQVLIVRGPKPEVSLTNAPVAASYAHARTASWHLPPVRPTAADNGRRNLGTLPARIQDSGALVGRVTAVEQGQGLGNVLVTLEGTDHTRLTGPDGRYIFAGLPAGQYSVSASTLGRRSITHDVTVRAGGTARVDFVLQIEAISLDELVVTGTVVPTAIREVPTPVTVVTRSDIERLAPRNVAELVRSTVPGAVHTNEGPAARYGSFSVRGVSGLGAASTLKVYIDGVEVSDPAYITNLDPGIVERVEIISGPQASTIYGSRAISGVMQIFTRRASEGHWTRPRISGKVAVQQVESPYVDDRPRGVEYGTTVSGGDLAFGYTIGVTVKEEPQWLDLLNHRNRNFFTSVNFARDRFEGGVSARFQEGYDESFWNPLYRELYQATGQPDNPPSSQVYDSDLRTYSLRLGFRATPWWQHNFTTGYDGFERHWYDRVPNANSQYGVRLNDTYRTSMAYNTSIQRSLTRDVEAKVVLGADRSRYSLDSYGTIFVSDWRSYPRPELSTAWRRNSNGYFGQVQLGHREAIFLTTGLRADRYPSGSNVGTNWSPRVGLTGVFEVNNFTVKPRVAWGQSVIVPDERAVGGDDGPSSLLLPNADIRSQVQRGYDAGVDVFLPGRTSIGLTFFDQDPIDLIQLIRLGTDTTGASPRAIFQYQNLHRVKNRGWELKLEAQPRPELSLGANYGRTRSTVRALDPSYTGDFVVGQQIPGRPTWTAAARAAYAPIPGTNLSLDMVHFASWEAADFYGYLYDIYSGQYDASQRPYPSGYQIDYPALTKWNGGVSQALPHGLTAFVHVHNLTNTDRFERMNMIIPQPRTWTVGLRFDGLGS